MDWNIISLAVPAMLVGVGATLRICAVAMIIATAIGVIAGVASLSTIAPVRWVTRVYTDFVRATPLLIQLLLIYFALPALGIRLSEFWAGVIALSINAGGFISEGVRGAINGIDTGQSEAAKAIGMTQGQTLRHILLPQAIRSFLPPLTNELISLVKNSALLSVISVYELTRAGQAIIATHFKPVEVYLLLALFYWALISGIAALSRLVERRFAQ
jgi:His/Glu/Gln/Arg/opine family amino acid ABC transporter permease subunit